MDLTSRLTSWSPQILSVLRIAVSLLFMQHGTVKLLNYPPVDDYQFPELFSLRFFAGILELFGGALLLLGLFTRPVAFILSGQMAVAYFLVHAPRDFFPIANGGTLAAIYCFVFFYLVFAGGGAWSLDAVRGQREHAPSLAADDQPVRQREPA
jgi:putative oxidoreductase